MIDPSIRLSLAPKERRHPEVDMSGDQGNKMIFYTDGKKPDVSADEAVDIAAKWDGSKLVSDGIAEERLMHAHLNCPKTVCNCSKRSTW